MERSFDEHDIVAVYIDGIEVAGHHVVAAVGLDDSGEKHRLGLVRGSSENAGVVKDLLQVYSNAASMRACSVCS
jgi:hypothetical protein